MNTNGELPPVTLASSLVESPKQAVRLVSPGITRVGFANTLMVFRIGVEALQLSLTEITVTPLINLV